MQRPLPAFFSIATLAEYWQCSESTVYQYIISDYLRPSFAFNGIICSCQPGFNSAPEDGNSFLQQQSWSGVFTLEPEFSDLLNESGYSLTETGWLVDAKYWCFVIPGTFDYIKPQESVFFRYEDILITNEELARIEKDFLGEEQTAQENESHAQYATRRVDEGADREKVALELYHRGATDFNLGRVLSKVQAGDDKNTITKRGLRFREKNNLPSKNRR